MARNSIVFRRTSILLGVVLIASGLVAAGLGVGSGDGMGKGHFVVIGLGVVLIAGGLASRLSRTVLIPALIVLVTYVIFEVAVTFLYLGDVFERPATFWLFEDSGKTVHFDTIRGYRLTPEPSRITRITNGTVEYVGALKGNNLGFPDRDDFEPERGDEPGKRFAVFGDSYSAAQFLNQNWPDHVEDLAGDAPTPMHLLNFSVDGGGLANWWSVLTRLVARDGYEIDGVIFAIIPGDLWRGFTISDHQGQDRPMFGRINGWDPETFPSTLEEARKHFRSMTSNGHIVSQEKFDQALNMEWQPTADKLVRPYFAWKCVQALRGRLAISKLPTAPPRAFDPFEPGQEWMIEDMAITLKTMGVSVMVVHVPSREGLLADRGGVSPPLDLRVFASMLGATVVDGRAAYAGLSEEEIRAMWLPYDAHWAQPGSNRFAEYMTGVLSTWP